VPEDGRAFDLLDALLAGGIDGSADAKHFPSEGCCFLPVTHLGNSAKLI
jgi:hypothetical protein